MNVFAQPETSKLVLMDIGHKQVFYNDPSNMHPEAGGDLNRVKYMTGELEKNLEGLNATLGFVREEITSKELNACDLLFIHVPSAQFNSAEVLAIKDYLQKGGALFIVMDGDYWTTLEKANANNLITPFGIKYGGMSPDTSSGGRTVAGSITDGSLKISYHGSRQVEGGTPFCFNNQSEDYPFGVFKELANGGKIVAMGDGMTSLYMTSWEGVDDYECQLFMGEVLGWLLN